MTFLQNKRNNILTTAGISILCFFLFHKSGALDEAGMAAIILNWLPFIIGIATIILYFILNFFTKKYAWIGTLLGNLFNILLVIRALMESV